MLKKIVQTAAVNGLSTPSARKLLTVSAGEYSGRTILVIQTDSNELKFASADPPYSDWSDISLLASDSGSLPFEAVMDASGNVYVAYSEQGTGYLVVRKLTLTAGEWSVGAKTYVYDGAYSLAPSLAIETGGRLWISWSRLSSGYQDIQVKTSDDGGVTWGSGPSDLGETLKTGMPTGYSRLVLTPGNAHVVYVGTGTDIFTRSRMLTGGEWSSEYTVATGTDIDEHFDAGASSDGLLGIVFDDGQPKYREYDGNNWGAVITLDDTEAGFPQLSFTGDVPAVCYVCELTTGQQLIKYTHRRSGVFSDPEVLGSHYGVFGGVVAYDGSSQSYADLSGPAADVSVADVWHPNSGCLLKSVSDELYLGMETPFRSVTFALSTAGVGGMVIYSYWDGVNWKSFTPSGGGFNLDGLDKQLILWDDTLSIPTDWQRCTVNGSTHYWMKLAVSSVFTTGPVGSMITAIAAIEALATGR